MLRVGSERDSETVEFPKTSHSRIRWCERIVPVYKKLIALSPVQFKELHYAPTVLLESKFDASITDHADFPVACAWGYDAYFDEMYQWNADRTAMLFVEHIHTLAEVQAKLIEEDRLADTLAYATPVGWSAGFWLGWLSAFALVRPSDACAGLALLTVLVSRWQMREQNV